MSLLMAFGLVVVGLVLLVAGAEGLVRGAAGLAERFGISPLVIGLTVVAFGTSAPEVAVSVSATLNDQPGVALGNVVGSNIFNVLFILGVSALIVPLVVHQQLIRFDVPVMIGVSVGAWLMALDGRISLIEGAVLIAGLVAYTVWTVLTARKASVQPELETPSSGAKKPMKLGWLLVLLLVGLGACALGAQWLVKGAVSIAQAAGVSELVIGLTIVAAGTSLPEVAASIAAAVRGQRDLAVGNVIGSNLFNLLGILGLSSVLGGLGDGMGVPVPPEALRLDIPMMVLASVACLPIFFTGIEIRRWEGGLFLAAFVGYTVLLVLTAMDHALAGAWRIGLLWGLLPVGTVAVGISVIRSLVNKRRSVQSNAESSP